MTSLIWQEMAGSVGNAQIFAIGDVHGQSSLLQGIVKEIRTRPRTSERRILIFLGDLVDRGPDSLGCVNIAWRNAREAAKVDEVILLPGNHELLLHQALRGTSEDMRLWLRNGGDALFAEVEGFDCSVDRKRSLERHLPSGFLDHIAQGPTFARVGDLLFVHAGIDPEVDEDSFLKRPRFSYSWNGEEHWAWIRDPFLYHEGPFKAGRRVVVHGHTPISLERFTRKFPFWKTHRRSSTHYRINIDGGAANCPQVILLEAKGSAYRVSCFQGME